MSEQEVVFTTPWGDNQMTILNTEPDSAHYETTCSWSVDPSLTVIRLCLSVKLYYSRYKVTLGTSPDAVTYTSSGSGVDVIRLDAPSAAYTGLTSGSLRIVLGHQPRYSSSYKEIRVIAIVSDGGGGGGGDDPDVPPPIESHPSLGKRIVVYAPDTASFGSLGLTVLNPKVCTVHQVAGGDYSLHLEQPITRDGRWRFLTDQAIIRAPIPPEHIPEIKAEDYATTDMEYKVYRTTNSTPRYTESGASLSMWQRNHDYKAGDYIQWSYGTIRRCRTDHNSGNAFDGSKWSTPSPPPKSYVTETTSAGVELYLLKDKTGCGGMYIYAQTKAGATGYWLSGDVEYVRTETVTDKDDIPAQDISEQFFRITNIVRNSDRKMVIVEASQLTYDYAKEVLTMTCECTDTAVADAIASIKGAVSGSQTRPYIICAKFQDTQTITADYTYQNVVYCLLDPDVGIVSQVRARIMRDKWKFYLLTNTNTNRGFRIRYATNLVGVKWTRGTENLVTRIYPRGLAADGSLLAYEDSQGRPYIDSTRIDEYPFIAVEALDTGVKAEGSSAEEIAEARNQMQLIALKRFGVDFADAIEEEIDVDFVMLGQSEQYAQYRDLQQVALYDTVTVEHGPLGLMATAQVREYEWDALRCRFNKIVLGNIWTYGMRTVAGYEIQDGVIRWEKLAPATISKIRGD